MTHVAFLGLGAMGSRMAANLLQAGHNVTVWNRSAGPMEHIARKGARMAQSPRHAAVAAEVVISMVFDDAASHAVWLEPETGAMIGMAQRTLGIECSTLSPAHVGRLHESAAAKGLAFIDAPVAGSRPQADAGQLLFMAGGAEADVAKARPLLLAMGTALHHAGGPGAGSVVKLMVNTLFGTQVATLAELLGMASKAGIEPATAMDIVGSTAVASAAVKIAATAMLARNFAPAAPINLIAKDLHLAKAMGDTLEQQMPMASAAEAVYRQASREGYGADNITGVVQSYIPASPY